MKFRATTIFIIIVVMVCLVATTIGGISHFRYTSQGAVIRYLQAHKQDVAVACFDPGNPEAGFYHNADEAYPLASTFKVVLLAAYAQEAAAGRLNPQEEIPVSALDAYYLPGTDGNAHLQFLQSLGEGRSMLTLSEAVDGMMTYSSNAAADYVYNRVKNSVSFPELYRRIGLAQTSEPFSYLGLYLFMANHETGHYAQEEISLQALQAEQARLENLFVSDPAWREAEIRYTSNEGNRPNLNIQREVTSGLGMKGSARDLGRLLLAAYGYLDALTPQEQAIMRQHLEWPGRLNPENTQSFGVLAAKGGAWPGVFTSAWYAETPSGTKTVLSVLYQKMPEDFWNAWLVSFSQQVLEVDVLSGGDCARYAEALE